MPYLGESAALLTSVAWAASSVLSTIAARRTSSRMVNAGRLCTALLFLLALHALLWGRPFPWDTHPKALGWLLASGLIGFALGDGLGLQSYVLLGPRLASLVMISSPVLSALLGWLFLGQALGPARLAFIGLTLAGIAWVVGERGSTGDDVHRRWGTGLLLATGAALCQAVGLLFSKFGLAGGLPPLSATLVRVVAGAVGSLAWLILAGSFRESWGQFRRPAMLALVVVAGFLSITVGVFLSLVAIAHARLGVAATLMSLYPVLLVPLSAWAFRERISPRAVAGTLVALAGAAGLFLR